MKKQAILDIALKIIGILMLKNALVSVFSAISSLLLYFQDQGNYPYPLMAIFHSTVLWIIIYLILGFLLLKYSNVLAAKLLKNGPDLDIDLPDDWEKRIFSIAVKILGVLSLIHGIADICPHFWEWSINESRSTIFGMPRLGTALTNVAIGLYLLLGGAKLVRIAYPKIKKKEIEEEWECSECGATVSADATTCPKCGADVSEINAGN